MSKRKWGESFLKSGLPLEYLTMTAFKSLGWKCEQNVEYQRKNRDGKIAWFELDLSTISPQDDDDTELGFLIECKYHDLSRFWMFFPWETNAFANNSSLFNPAPFQILAEPLSKSGLSLAPISHWGSVVSESGVKLENTFRTALEQIANGFVPYSLSQMFGFNLDVHGDIPWVTAFVPMIVTNARLYRLKPEINNLDNIRLATQPDDIADELEWTWYFYEPTLALIDQNLEAINSHKGGDDKELISKYPVAKRMERFYSSPNWIAVVNINYLKKTIETIYSHFLSLNKITAREAINKGNPLF